MGAATLTTNTDGWKELVNQADAQRTQPGQQGGGVPVGGHAANSNLRSGQPAKRLRGKPRLQQVVDKLLRKNNAASELEVLESQIRIQKLNSQIDEAINAAPRLRAAQSEAESRVKEAVARFQAEASSALTEVREDLEKLSHEIGTSVDRLDRNVVRSPVAGFINKLNISTIGAVVRPSEILLEITPSDERFVIQTRSNPNDRAHLRRGLPARVRIGAYDYATYGTFEGHVTEVSSDTLIDERDNHYYRVNIEVDVSTIMSRARQPGVLMPGMAASVDIAVGKRTVLSYILSPLLKFRDGAFRAN